MEQKKILTETQKEVLRQKLQERLLNVAVSAMKRELEKVMGEKDIHHRLVFLMKAKTVTITYRSGDHDLCNPAIDIDFRLSELPDSTCDVLLSRVAHLFLFD